MSCGMFPLRPTATIFGVAPPLWVVRRCEQIQGLRAASAQNADICEEAKRAEGAASAHCDD